MEEWLIEFLESPAVMCEIRHDWEEAQRAKAQESQSLNG